MTPDQARAAQLEQALAAILDNAVKCGFGQYLLDDDVLDEARALLYGDSEPVNQEES